MPRVIAFYLPQYHAVPENDAWHGTGFTEWNVVARSRPLFPGHDQPHLPADLGFYDLRVPEVREAQARLARRAGISGFLYYHYWFRGRRMLERTFGEVLRSGRPDFPFALCWANESWFRRWQHESDELLLEQTYDEADDLEHIRWLIDAFRDPRYIRVHGRPLLAVYRPHLLADPKVTFDVWREECATAGLAEPWLVAFETEPEIGDPADLGFDASAEFVPHGLHLLVDPVERPAGMDVAGTLYDYTAAAAAYLGRPPADWTRYPCVASGWDNTPRRPDGDAIMLHGSTPEGYRAWLVEAIAGQARSEGAHGIVFVNAWNEWGEGAHLEPDVTNGRAYLDATRSAVEATATADAAISPVAEDDCDDAPSMAPATIEDLYSDLRERFVRLQSVSSGLEAHAHRRLTAQGRHYERELAAAREESQRLALVALDLEERLSMAEQRTERLMRLLDSARDTGEPDSG